jgi:thiosulfate dehydrogenase
MQALVRLMAAAAVAAALIAPLAQAAAPRSGRAAVDAAVIARGKRLVEHTKELLPAFTGASLTCASCHINFAHGAGPLSFAGIAGHYPQYSSRTRNIVALRDRIAECFFFSMNGRPPSYFGPDLIAIEAYIAFLSRGATVGPAPAKTFAYRAPATVSTVAGRTIYVAQCAACHGTTGAGNASAGFPPLWGPRSFNDRAGMNRLMAGFVQAHMPLGRGGTLTDQQAADVSAFVLAHPRPRFNSLRFANLSAAERRFFRI